MSTTISTGPALPPDEAARRAAAEFEEAGRPQTTPEVAPGAPTGRPAPPGPVDLPPAPVAPPADAGIGRKDEPAAGR